MRRSVPLLVVLGGLALASCGNRGATVRASRPDRSTFAPTGVSFVTPQLGWVLGRTCTDCRLSVRSTRDGGARWEQLPDLPSDQAGQVSDIAFANAKDGDLFGPSLLATRDAGRTWTPVALPPVSSLALGGGYAYALTSTGASYAYALWRGQVSAVAGAGWSCHVPRAAPIRRWRFRRRRC